MIYFFTFVHDHRNFSENIFRNSETKFRFQKLAGEIVSRGNRPAGELSAHRISWSGVDQRFTTVFQAFWIWSCKDAFSYKNIKYSVFLQNFQADPSAHPVNIHEVTHPEKFWTYPKIFLWKGTWYPHPFLKTKYPSLPAPPCWLPPFAQLLSIFDRYITSYHL